MAKPGLYSVWANMKTRCNNHSVPCYERYGGRGISYCEDWEHFDNFARDMSDGYSLGLSLERKNNNLGYSKDNCCWATPLVQANNRRNTKLLTYKGETHSIADWCRLLGLKLSTVKQRIYCYGWSTEEALEVERFGRR